MPKTMLTARIQNDLFDALEEISTEKENKTFHVERALNEYKPIKSALKPRRIEIDVPSGINVDAWNEWVDYRKNEKKKTITKAAASKQFRLLLGYTKEQQQQVIDISIQNDYQGLFPIKGFPAPKKEQDFVIKHTDTSWSDGL